MNTSGIPTPATFDEIGQRLQRGEIERWYIDPRVQNPADTPNVNVTFITKTGGIYIVRARFDQRTNQIFPPTPIMPLGTRIPPAPSVTPVLPQITPHLAPPPVEVIPEIRPPNLSPATGPSLIRWENSYKIFVDETNITPMIPNSYEDEEILGHVPQNYFDPIFESIDSFQSQQFQYYLNEVDVEEGRACALLKEWIGNNARMQFWITTGIELSAWAIIYGTPNTFLIVKNNGGHASVTAPTFYFYSSEASTFEDIDSRSFDLPSLNLDQVKNLLKTKALQFTFNQQ